MAIFPVLALFQLTTNIGRGRASIGEVLNRLHEKGLIDNPMGKTKSISMTDEGLKASEQAFAKLFAAPP